MAKLLGICIGVGAVVLAVMLYWPIQPLLSQPGLSESELSQPEPSQPELSLSQPSLSPATPANTPSDSADERLESLHQDIAEEAALHEESVEQPEAEQQQEEAFSETVDDEVNNDTDIDGLEPVDEPIAAFELEAVSTEKEVQPVRQYQAIWQPFRSLGSAQGFIKMLQKKADAQLGVERGGNGLHYPVIYYASIEQLLDQLASLTQATGMELTPFAVP
ncbi:MAG: hypothetical protein CMF25_00615 [Kangiellaceae bacterium]|nr:hypothetical protein [Kangiellaceae bacterium]